MLILTRPRSQNDAWAAAFAEHGVACMALPLIDVSLRGDSAYLAEHNELVRGLFSVHAIMHVSPNAVEGFWNGTAVKAWMALRNSGYHAPRLWAPGPGTAQALQALGFPKELIDQPAPEALQPDSEALWHTIAPSLQKNQRVWILRGADAALASTNASAETPGAGHGRDWLTAQLQAKHIDVQLVVVYLRRQPVWTEEQCKQAEAASGNGHVWLFSSSQALLHLGALLPQIDLRAHRALATHPRILAKAQAMGFGQTALARPNPQAVTQVLKSRFGPTN